MFFRRHLSARSAVCGLVPGAALLAVVCALLPSAAPAATLQLAGPAGARVTLDGTAVGVLPLSAPLTVAIGTHDLLCEQRGLHPHRLQVRIEQDDEWRHVTLRPLPYSRRTALLSSVAVAGGGQRYLGQSTRGWFYTAAEAGGLLTALLCEISRSNANDEYVLALDAYDHAVNQDQIESLRAAVVAKRQDVKDAADRRDLGLAVAAGAVVVSVLDAWLSFGHVTSGAGELPAVSSAGTSGPLSPVDAFHAAVRLDF